MSPAFLSPDSCRLPAVVVGLELGLTEAERHTPRAQVQHRRPGLYQALQKEVDRREMAPAKQQSQE